MPNYHEPVTSQLETDIASVLSAVSGVQTDISTLSTEVATVQTTVSGSTIDVSSIVNSLLDTGDSVVGIPNVNVGNRIQGHKCTTSATETTLFVTNTAGFAFVQAYGDASLGSSAIVRVYSGSIATENLVAYAIIPAGTSQVVICSPAYTDTGFVVTAQADGTNPVCVSFSYYSPSDVSTTDYQTGNDTYLDLGNPTNNYSTQTKIYVQRQNASQRDWGLLKFNLSSIPVGSLVTHATLTLTGSSASNLDDFQIRQMLVDWVEAEATWNEKSTGVGWDAAGLTEGVDYSATVAWNGSLTLSAGGTQSLDITSLVQRWVNLGEANYGMFLFMTVNHLVQQGNIASFNHGTSAYRPKLTVSLV